MAMASATAITERRFVPEAGGQTNFLSRAEYEAVMLGDTGHGKTWCLIVDALGVQFQATTLGMRAIDVPTYRAIIFRRKTTHLSKLIDESQKLYPSLGGTFLYHREGDPGPSWTFPSGARIFLCHMEDEKNKFDHDGIEYQYVGFDEIQQFTITQYLYLQSRLRSTVRGLFTRVRGTGMAVGSGWWWVRKRFNLSEPGIERFYTGTDDPETNPKGIEVAADHPDARSRVFILGLLSENTYVNRQEYEANVKQLGTRYERAMLRHDWDAFGGDFFKEFDFTTEVIDPFQVPEEWPLICSIDPGWGGICAASLLARDFEEKVHLIGTYYEQGRNNDQNADGIYDFWKENIFTSGRTPNFFIAGKDAWAQKDRYAIHQSELDFAGVFQSHGMMLQPAVTDRINGWGTLRNLMSDRFFVFKGYNDPFLDEIVSVMADEKVPEDIQGRGNDPKVKDHALDNVRYGCMALYVPHAKKDQPKVPTFMKKALERRRAQSGDGFKVGMS